MIIKNIKDDIEARNTVHGIKFQSVNPITRKPTGPLRSDQEQAEADDEAEFLRKQRRNDD